MMRTFLHWLTSKMKPPRVIPGRAGRSKYMSRWYLLRRPYMEDGSEPFDENGQERPGMKEKPGSFGEYLHCMHRGDDDRALHSHPWKWAVSIVIAGGYIEERRGPYDSVQVHRRGPGSIYILRSTDYHRVDLIGKESWSLFITGKRLDGWSFWDRWTGETVPWKQFLASRRT